MTRRSFPATLRQLAGDSGGAAAAEFVMVAPVLALVFAGTFDLGNIVYVKMKVQDALNTGANYALVQAKSVSAAGGATLASDIARIVRNNEGTPYADASVEVNNGPTAANNGTATSGGTASQADQCYCPTVAFARTAPYAKTYSYGAAVACQSACAGGGKAGKFVRITASHSYSPLFIGYGIVQAGSISETTEVQVS